jgi:hypothetical protein
MPGVTEEQITVARNVDLLTCLWLNEPGELKRSGAGEYRTVSRSSLVISNGRWFCWKAGIGGFGAFVVPFGRRMYNNHTAKT